MFPIPNLWLIAAIAASLIAGVVWHEHKISTLKADILAQERQRVAFASERLQKEEQKRAADIAAESEREASAHEEAMAHRDKEIAEANAKIAEMEKGNRKCVVSRQVVRQINRGR